MAITATLQKKVDSAKKTIKSIHELADAEDQDRRPALNFNQWTVARDELIKYLKTGAKT